MRLKLLSLFLLVRLLYASYYHHCSTVTAYATGELMLRGTMFFRAPDYCNNQRTEEQSGSENQNWTEVQKAYRYRVDWAIQSGTIVDVQVIHTGPDYSSFRLEHNAVEPARRRQDKSGVGVNNPPRYFLTSSTVQRHDAARRCLRVAGIRKYEIYTIGQCERNRIQRRPCKRNVLSTGVVCRQENEQRHLGVGCDQIIRICHARRHRFENHRAVMTARRHRRCVSNPYHQRLTRARLQIKAWLVYAHPVRQAMPGSAMGRIVQKQDAAGSAQRGKIIHQRVDGN